MPLYVRHFLRIGYLIPDHCIISSLSRPSWIAFGHSAKAGGVLLCLAITTAKSMCKCAASRPLGDLDNPTRRISLSWLKRRSSQYDRAKLMSNITSYLLNHGSLSNSLRNLDRVSLFSRRRSKVTSFLAEKGSPSSLWELSIESASSYISNSM